MTRSERFVCFIFMLALIFPLILVPVPVRAAPSDDWIAIQVNRIKVGDRNWGTLFDGDADLRLLMIVQHDDEMPMAFAYPSTGTLSVPPRSSLALGKGGLSLTVPRDSGIVRVVLIAVDSDETSEAFDLGTSAFLSFISTLVGKRITDFIMTVQKVAQNVLDFVGWLIGFAVEQSATAVVEYFKQNDEIGEAALILNGRDNWSADGQEHQITSSNGVITFTYEVRLAKRQLEPTPVPAPAQRQQEPKLDDWMFRAYDEKLDSNAYCIACAYDWVGPSKPGSFTWRQTAPANRPIFLSMGWCAVDNETLYDNWSDMRFELFIDGTEIDLSRILPVIGANDGEVCYLYNGVLSGWTSGSHSYTWIQHIYRSVDDGQNVFEKGDYTMRFLVTVKDRLS